jgi:hypothetical protein
MMAQALAHLFAVLAALLAVVRAIAIRRTGGSIFARFCVGFRGVRWWGTRRLREGACIHGEPRDDQGLKKACCFHADLHKVAADYGTAAGRRAWLQRLCWPFSRTLAAVFAFHKLKHRRGVRSKNGLIRPPLLEFRIPRNA